MTGNITYTDCLTGNQSSIPFDWYQGQTDAIFVCACFNTVVVNWNEPNDYDITQTSAECTLNQYCTCYQAYIDGFDFNASDDNIVYLRVQECDGSWVTRFWDVAGTYNICIMNLWDVSGNPSLSMYILQGGNPSPVGYSTITNLNTPCSGTIC
jgi:hypothetical protein